MCKIIAQNYGTNILLFLEGETRQAAYEKWLSLFNWNTVQGEPDWVKENICCCWSTPKRLKDYFFNIRVGEFLSRGTAKYAGKKDGFYHEAKQLADGDYAGLEWDKYLSIHSEPIDWHETGVIEAEKPDYSIEDSILNHAFADKS